MNYENIKILIVDDDFINRKIARKFLAKLGWEADQCESGEESLSLDKKNAYDLILMDIQMPGIDGMQACQKLKEQGSDAIIVAVSANDEDSDLQKYLAAGMDDVLPKPLNRESLEALIKNHFSS